MAATNQSRLHVGIVGAGISGLRCADVLLSHGFRVTILEARSRIGGRVSEVLLFSYINANEMLDLPIRRVRLYS